MMMANVVEVVEVLLVTVDPEESLSRHGIKEAPIGKKSGLIILMDFLHQMSDLLQVSAGVNFDITEWFGQTPQ